MVAESISAQLEAPGLDSATGKAIHFSHRLERESETVIRLAQIDQFVAIVDTGSIRAAARQLGVSQPNLTRNLQQLEHDLGVQLLQRTSHGVSLTRAGSSFLSHARVAREEMRKAADEARRVVATERGLLSIGVSPVGAALLLPDFVNTLRRAHPECRIRIMEMAPTGVLPLVRDEVLDLGIAQRTTLGLDAGLKFRPLFELQMRVASRPGHPLSGPRDLRDLQGAVWLAMTAPGSSEDIVNLTHAKLGIPAPVPAVHCGSYSVSLDLVSTSDLVTVLPPVVLRECIRTGKLQEIPLREPLLPLVVGSYTRLDSPPTPLARAAAQVIQSIARRLAADGSLRSTAPL